MLRGAARAEDADLLRQRPATERFRQHGAAARHDQRGASGPTSRSIRSTPAASRPLRRSAMPRERRRRQRRLAVRRLRWPASSQASQDTLFALAKDTGGKAMFDYNDLSLGIVAGRSGRHRLLHRRLLQHAHRDRWQVPPRAASTLTGSTAGATSTYRQGYYADKTFANFNDRRQGAPARRGVHARGSDHRDHDRDGAELLPAESRRVLRAGGDEDSRQRARRWRAAAAPRGRSIDFIGEIKDEYGITIQNIRDSIDDQAERRRCRAARAPADSVRERLHAAAGQVRDQGARARRHDRPHRHVSDAVRRSRTSCARAAAHPDQLSRAEQPARARSATSCSP